MTRRRLPSGGGGRFPPPRPLATNHARQVINLLASNWQTRGEMARALGMDPPTRNLDKECGYPDHAGIQLYRRLYARHGLAARVNDFWPNECWQDYPDLYETEEDKNTDFERAWKRLNNRVPAWAFLHRADRLSGIGRFGVVLLGLNDGRPLDKPVRGLLDDGSRPRNSAVLNHELLYLRVFSEDLVTVGEIETNPNSPRAGEPKWYNVTFSTRGPTERDQGPMEMDALYVRTARVHWTRMLHVCDGRMSSEVYGVPRMEACLERLLDLRKILGGSAEMFWKGAFPGFSVETVGDLIGMADLDEETIKEQMEEYYSGLKRYLAFDGAKVNPILPQIADPTAHVTQQIAFICATIEAPYRVFMGSEAGHLASTQDAGTLNKRVRGRQLRYINPFIIRPFVDRLILLGVLPAPARKDYIIGWNDLNTPTDTDKADIALKTTQALMQYVTSGAEKVMPVREFLSRVLRYTRDETDAIWKTVKELAPAITKEVWQQPAALPQGGGRTGKSSGSQQGRPARTTPRA